LKLRQQEDLMKLLNLQKEFVMNIRTLLKQFFVAMPLLLSGMAVNDYVLAANHQTNLLSSGGSTVSGATNEASKLDDTIIVNQPSTLASTSNCKWECWYDPITKRQQCGYRCPV
jgi:hypothetical protein